MKNTITNYAMVVVRLLQGILVTRWLIHGLGETYYGLWALLWTYFVYGLLLDFGLGITAQKYTATGLYKSDCNKFNMVISTIFSFHLLMSCVILLGNYIASFYLSELFSVTDPELLEYCRSCFWLFGIGTACIFPLGIFPEMMVGLKKIYLRNYINFAAKIAELLGVCAIMWNGGHLRLLICFSLGLTMVTNLVMGYFVFRSIPAFRLKVRIRWKIFKEITHFSAYMYVIAFSRLIMTRISRPLIGIYCGLDTVGNFQLASTIPQYCNQITQQYQENVYPLSAELHSQGKREALKTMVLNSMRWNSFLATGVMAIMFVMTDAGLAALFHIVNPEVSGLCRWLLFSMYVTTVCRSIPHNFLVMADRHKMIAVITVLEAFLNLFFYLLLLPVYGVFAIVWVVVFFKLAFAVFWILPFLIRNLHFNLLEFVGKIYLLPALAAVLPIAFLVVLGRIIDSREDIWSYFLIGGTVSSILYFVCSWVGVLNAAERQRAVAFLQTKLLTRPKNQQGVS